MEYQKIGNNITKILKTSQHNNSETVKNEHDKETPRKDIYFQMKDKKLLII